MVYKCCVPGCNGNSNKENKVSVFSFPKDEDLQRGWMSVIPRNFTPTKNSKVCVRHFKEGQIERTAEACDSRTGIKIVAPLYTIRLKKGAVPCIFPMVKNIPNSKRLKENDKSIDNAAKSKPKVVIDDNSGENVPVFKNLQKCHKKIENLAKEDKKKREKVEKVIRKIKLRKKKELKQNIKVNDQPISLIKENVELQKDNMDLLAEVQKETDSKKDEKNCTTFPNFEDFEKSLSSSRINGWHQLKVDSKLVFAVISAHEKPIFLLSATVNNDFQIRLFNGKKEVKKRGGKTYPAKIHNLRDLKEALESLLLKYLENKVEK